jgi:hypothetical protein
MIGRRRAIEGSGDDGVEGEERNGLPMASAVEL